MKKLPDALHVRVRLRHRGRELACPVGEYVIGRGSSCDVTVDDGRVSRRHARLVVTERGASIHDLGSANGVFVAGEQIGERPRELKNGDRLMLGSEELWVRIDAVGEDSDRGTTQPEPVPAKQARPERGKSQRPKRAPAGVTTRGLALEVIGILADQALEAKNPGRAEELLSKHLAVLVDGGQKGTLSDSVRDSALRRALALARATAKASWFDYAVDLLTQQGAFPSKSQADELRSAFAQVGAVDAEKLERYAKLVRSLPISGERMRTLRLIEQFLLAAGEKLDRKPPR